MIGYSKTARPEYNFYFLLHRTIHNIKKKLFFKTISPGFYTNRSEQAY